MAFGIYWKNIASNYKMDWMKNEDTKLPYEPAVFCIDLIIRASWEAPIYMRLIERKDELLYFETIDQKTVIELEMKAQFLRLLANVNLSIPPKPVIGVDGTFFELSISSLWNKFSFNWWSDEVDENWQAVVQLKNALMQLQDNV